MAMELGTRREETVVVMVLELVAAPPARGGRRELIGVCAVLRTV